MSIPTSHFGISLHMSVVIAFPVSMQSSKLIKYIMNTGSLLTALEVLSNLAKRGVGGEKIVPYVNVVFNVVY